jgi:hypothetical protein
MSRPGVSEEQRRIAGSRRVALKYAQQSNQDIHIQDTSTPFTLPTSSEELGRFPYSQSDSSTTTPLLNPELFPVTDYLSYGSTGDVGSWPTDINLGTNMDQLFYDQTATIFSTPFGEMTEEELATAILNASATQAMPNDAANAYQTPVDPK